MVPALGPLPLSTTTKFFYDATYIFCTACFSEFVNVSYVNHLYSATVYDSNALCYEPRLVYMMTDKNIFNISETGCPS